MSLSNSKKRVYRQFFEKTGIQLTDEPELSGIPALDDQVEFLHGLSQKSPKKAIPLLLDVIERYPNSPALKNYLYVAYARSNQMTKAKVILERTIKEHPNYLFGRTNKIFTIEDKEEMEKHAYLLGKPRDVRTIMGHDKPIHSTGFISYQEAAIHYEVVTGDTDSATKRLQSLIEVEASPDKIKRIVGEIAIGRMLHISTRMQARNAQRIIVEDFPKTIHEATDKPPVLHHQELTIFYKREVNTKFRTTANVLTPKEIDQILALPKATLIQDLETILVDGIRRYGHFRKVGIEDESRDFIMHALYYLGALKSESSLQKVLDLLRMGDEFTDFWWGDLREDFTFPTLYQLGEQQLEVLKAFVLEGNNAAFNRLLVTDVVSQIALHQPNRRAEVNQWFKDVLTTILEHPKKEVLDTTFIGFSIGGIIKYRGIELLPIIEKLDKEGWVLADMYGDLAEITGLLQKEAAPHELKPFPENIQEYYSLAYYERGASRPPLSDEERREMEEEVYGNTAAEKLVTEQLLKSMGSIFSGNQPNELLEEDEYVDDLFFDDDYDDYEYVRPVQPIIRTTPKIGRNDPCSCGSGKKYKKCCLRK